MTTALLLLVALPLSNDGSPHWAFRPVSRSPIPEVREETWPLTPIDRFILAGLESRGLRPAPRAERSALIRRITFDLLGIPPTPEEVEAYVTDSAPEAWAKVVDRLLSSPHYGERWGRHWLDVARYADTKGYVFFEEATFPWSYTYRDYVLQALNADLPYDRFLCEQIAADRLGGDPTTLPALGFLTLGGRFMNNVHDVIDDRIDVVTRGLLGLTVGCARCHDHKYDPVSMRDYYGLYGIFAASTEPTIPPLFADPPRTAQYEAFAKELATKEAKLTEFVRSKHEELVRGARTRVAEYLLAAHARRGQPSAEEFMLIADTADLNPTMIVRYQKYLERTAKRADPVWSLWHALADLPEAKFAAEASGVIERAAGLNPLVAGAFLTQPPKTIAEVARTYGKLLEGVERTAATTDDAPRAQLRAVLHGPEAPAQVAFLPYGDLSLLPDRPSQAKLQELRKAVEQWRAQGPGAPPRAMALEDRPLAPEARVFRRGNPNNPGEVVFRRFPEVLGGDDARPFRDGSGRLELARAITDSRNPLTARVMVNRVWMHHFGQGLVRTPGDFGLRGEPPTHPELLDWLAASFVAEGWSLKRLHRTILLSAVYQQSSQGESESADPENRLWGRVPRRRLDFESLRDALLVVSGRWERRLGGPSTPDLVTGSATRRTLYGHLDRLNVPGLYRTFDFPSPDATSPRRDTTTVSPQALFLMNHPFVRDCAQRLVRRPEIAGEIDRLRRVERLYSLVYSRLPRPEEATWAAEYLGAAPDQSAWERYAHALLLSNEFAFVD